MRRWLWTGLLLAAVPASCVTRCDDRSALLPPGWCGDGVIDEGELCDDGDANSDTMPNACRTYCLPADCGDGVRDEGECETPESRQQCVPECYGLSCADGIRQPDEACDDGNRRSHDGCDSICGEEVLTWVDRRPGFGQRTDHAVVYDEQRGRLVAIGGRDASDLPRADVWTYDGIGWSILDTHEATGPAARWGAAVVYRGDGEIVLTGGGDAAQLFDDTWVLGSDDTWRALAAPVRPSPRMQAGAVYLVGDAVVLLFGGLDDLGRLGDTWELDDAGWTERFLPITPPPNAYPTMAFDERREVAVLAPRDDSDDVWEYHGVGWASAGGELPPPGRIALLWHRAAAVLVAVHDTFQVLRAWYYHEPSRTWQETLSNAADPASRLGYQRAVAYWPPRRSLVLTGGELRSSGIIASDQIELRYESLLPDERCDNLRDDDGDGLTDCADPDCEGVPPC